MATEQKTSEQATAGSSAQTGSAITRRGQDSPLDTGHGQTTINDQVVSKVAGIAAREVPGVHVLGGGASRAFGAMTQRVGLGDERSQGVSVEVGEKEAAVDLRLIVEYGESIPQVAEAIRNNVIKRIEGITGLSVTEVNIAVDDLHFPGDDDSQDEPSRVQ